MSLDGIGRKKLEAKTVKELRQLCQTVGISGVSSAPKEDLIKELLKSKRKGKDERQTEVIENRLKMLTMADLVEIATRHKVDVKKSQKKEDFINELIATLKPENLVLSAQEVYTLCTKLKIIKDGEEYSESELRGILEKSHVGSARLKVATKEQLSEYCRLADLKVSGSKDELIERLIQDGIELFELPNWHLRALWRIECAAADEQDDRGPTKIEDVIIALCEPSAPKTTAKKQASTPAKSTTPAKLPTSPPAPASPKTTPATSTTSPKDNNAPQIASKKKQSPPPSPPAPAPAPDTKVAKKQRAQQEHKTVKAGLKAAKELSISAPLDRPMSREEYRRLLSKVLVVGEDQDVFHIIGHPNGGADHPHNYHFAQNRAFNRAIGANFDYVNAYMAGLAQTRLAVEVSKRLRGYDGPSAEDLYKKGEEFWRARRHERRGEAQAAAAASESAVTSPLSSSKRKQKQTPASEKKATVPAPAEASLPTSPSSSGKKKETKVDSNATEKAPVPVPTPAEGAKSAPAKISPAPKKAAAKKQAATASPPPKK